MKKTNNHFIIGLVLLLNGAVFCAIALSTQMSAFAPLGCSFLTLGTVALFLFHHQRKKTAPLVDIAAKRMDRLHAQKASAKRPR